MKRLAMVANAGDKWRWFGREGFQREMREKKFSEGENRYKKLLIHNTSQFT